MKLILIINTFLFVVIFFLSGCAVTPPQAEKYVKEGKQYGVIEGFIWRPTWWNFYRRGLSFAEGEFWEESTRDLKTTVGYIPGALSIRTDDQRRVRTYGLHFIDDYFPHRKLGIIYFKLGKYEAARAELERSLSTEESAKAKYYLNLTRRKLLKSAGVPPSSPTITLTSPLPDQVFNSPEVRVTGKAQSSNYIKAVSLNGKRLFVELAEKTFPFDETIQLPSGINRLILKAQGLLGGSSEKILEIYVDLQPPSVYIEEYVPGSQMDRVAGSVIDDWNIARWWIDNEEVKVGERTKEIAFSRKIQKGGKIKIKAEDWAGNRTEFEINPSREFLAVAADSHSMPAALFLEELFCGKAHATEINSEDSRPPRIKLKQTKDGNITWCDHIFLSGRVKDENKVSSLVINGEDILGKSSPLVYFNHRLELQEGENPVEIFATDSYGNRASQTLSVIRKTPEIFQTSSRYSLALLPLRPPEPPSTRAAEINTLLLGAFLKAPERFNFVEREKTRLEEILQEQKIGSSDLADPETALIIGRIKAAEGMLYGKIIEEKDGIAVYLWLVDTETTEILHFADVYDRDKSLESLKFLMGALALKFKQHFPLVSGRIILVTDDGFVADIGAGDGIRPGMKYLAYREVEAEREKVKFPLKVASRNIESRVISVEERSSYAEVAAKEGMGSIKKGDFIITK